MTVIASSEGLIALGKIYGFTSAAATFAVQHIDTLKAAENTLANRCGLVLEHMVVGFGVGAETALVLVGVGQGLLGNPLHATAAVAGGPFNPVALTCASIGAIVYGWKALSPSEQQQLLDVVGRAFKVGTEFLRSLIRFALDTISILLSKENIEELKKFVRTTAELFGKTLSEVTGAIGDRLAELLAGPRKSIGATLSAVGSNIPRLPFRPAKGEGAPDTQNKG